MWLSNLFKKKENAPTQAELNAMDKEIVERNSKLLKAAIPLIRDEDLCNEVRLVAEQLKYLIPSHKDAVIEQDKEISIEINRIISLLRDADACFGENELFSDLCDLKSRIEIRNADVQI